MKTTAEEEEKKERNRKKKRSDDGEGGGGRKRLAGKDGRRGARPLNGERRGGDEPWID